MVRNGWVILFSVLGQGGSCSCHLKIRLVSQGVVLVHFVYLGSLLNFRVCFLWSISVPTCMHLCLYHLSEFTWWIPDLSCTGLISPDSFCATLSWVYVFICTGKRRESWFGTNIGPRLFLLKKRREGGKMPNENGYLFFKHSLYPF